MERLGKHGGMMVNRWSCLPRHEFHNDNRSDLPWNRHHQTESMSTKISVNGEIIMWFEKWGWRWRCDRFFKILLFPSLKTANGNSDCVAQFVSFGESVKSLIQSTIFLVEPCLMFSVQLHIDQTNTVVWVCDPAMKGLKTSISELCVTWVNTHERV